MGGGGLVNCFDKLTKRGGEWAGAAFGRGRPCGHVTI